MNHDPIGRPDMVTTEHIREAFATLLRETEEAFFDLLPSTGNDELYDAEDRCWAYAEALEILWLRLELGSPGSFAAMREEATKIP